MKRITFFYCLFGLVLFIAPGISHAVTIYVAATNPPPGDGSEGNPYTAITSAVARLATENAAPNQGGHIISVKPGEYPHAVVFTNDHSGAAGNPNWLSIAAGEEPGSAIIYTNQLLVHNCSNLVVSGMMVQNSPSDGIFIIGEVNVTVDIVVTGCVFAFSANNGFYSRNTLNVSLYNCLSYGNDLDGFNTWGQDVAVASSSIMIDHCLAYGNAGSGVKASGMDCYFDIRNSVIAGNGCYGTGSANQGAIKYRNSLFYANGYYNASDYYLGFFDTADEINSVPNSSNNIVFNPGYIQLANEWTFTTIYSDSALLGNGEEGRNIGPYQNFSFVVPSNAVYYVCADTGDDTRTPGEASHGETPWKTIGRAAQTAGAGDTVLVNAGVYSGSVDIIRGGSRNRVRYAAQGNVMIQGGDSTNYAFNLDRVGDVLVEGFDISGYTGGLYVAHSMANTVRNCVIHDNNRYGVHLAYAPRTTLCDLYIYSNTTYGVYMGGAGIFSGGRYKTGSGGTVLERCRIYDHTAGTGLYSYQTFAPHYIMNCDIHSNNNGIYLVRSGKVYLYNCVINGNSLYGIYHGFESSMVFPCNTIFSGNDYGLYEGSGHVRTYFTNCSFHANTLAHMRYRDGSLKTTVAEINGLDGCVNNIDGNPLYRNIADADFRVRSSSPCIDAGTTNIVDLHGTDLYGNPRWTGTSVDIGSFEMPPAGTFIFGF